MFYKFPDDFKTFKLARGWSAHAARRQHVMFSLVTAQPNSEISLHSHRYEHMGLVLVGELEATIGDATKTLKKGDMYHVPSNITHSGKTREEKAIVLDTFSPPRDGNK